MLINKVVIKKVWVNQTDWCCSVSRPCFKSDWIVVLWLQNWLVCSRLYLDSGIARGGRNARSRGRREKGEGVMGNAWALLCALLVQKTERPMETSQAPIQAGRKNVKLSMHKQNYQMSVRWSRNTESVQSKPSVCLQSLTATVYFC